MTNLKLLLLIVVSQITTAASAHAQNTFENRDLDGVWRTVLVMGYDGKRYSQKVYYEPTENRLRANTIVRAQSRSNCGHQNRFHCLRLIRVVRANQDGAARQIFETPIPDIFTNFNKPQSDEFGAKLPVKAWTIPQDAVTLAKVVLSASHYSESVSSQWLSLERVNNVYEGAKALELLENLVGLRAILSCLETDEFCGQSTGGYFDFKAQNGDTGIAECVFGKILSVLSPPRICFVVVLRRSSVTYVRSLLSLDAIRSGFGAGGEGFACHFKSETSSDVALKAVKSAFGAPPLSMSMRDGRNLGRTLLVVGVKNGGQSDILRAIGKGIYYENLTFHGTISDGNDGPILDGFMSVNVNRNSAALEQIAYELGPSSERYINEVIRHLIPKLSREVSSQVRCEQN